MKPHLQQQLLAQLDNVKQAYLTLRRKTQENDMADLSPQDLERYITLAHAAVDRAVRPNSAYSQQAEKIITEGPYEGWRAVRLSGVVDALTVDLKAGYLQSIEELIHGELFGDFLEMSGHLLDEGYKDASTVIAGSALEAHLRQLCQRNAIDVEITAANGVRPKKADSMNSELAGASIYSKLDQKAVTAWLGLRNDAAHGHYEKYEPGQVRLMIDGVRDFIVRNPA